MRVMIFGANGMIGSAIFRVLSEMVSWKVFGSVRDISVRRFFLDSNPRGIIEGGDLCNIDALVGILNKIRPDIVINCAGLTKHKPASQVHLSSLPINTLMPHRLAELCHLIGARLIHISTDCVFSGNKGLYIEDDLPDALDVYGKTKALGEVTYSNALTLRTSTIGHELQSQFGLLDWFLAQDQVCRGYTRAIFSGLPSVVFAQVIRDFVIPNEGLFGLYHIGASPIDKFNLLKLIADVYGKRIEIVPDEVFELDRSLDSSRFYAATGYQPPEWPELIKSMCNASPFK
jgi:dTDP-4-dehydrorhamnose reductase